MHLFTLKFPELKSKFLSLPIMEHAENLQENYLPNLGNAMTCGQLILHNKVAKQNAKFAKIHSDIITWFKFPETNRKYPNHMKCNNKSSYHWRLKRYKYDESTEKLYKKVTNVDGIGKLLFDKIIIIFMVQIEIHVSCKVYMYLFNCRTKCSNSSGY